MKWIAGLGVVVVGALAWLVWTAKSFNDAMDRSDIPPVPAHPPEPDVEAELQQVDNKLRAIQAKVYAYRAAHGGVAVAKAKSMTDLKLPGVETLFAEPPNKWSVDPAMLTHEAKFGRRSARAKITPAIELPFLAGAAEPQPDMAWVRAQGNRLPIAMMWEGALGLSMAELGPRRYRIVRLDGTLDWHTVDGRNRATRLYPVVPGSAPTEMGPPAPRKLRFGRN
ncbi:MAG: hypothetical protein HONBIEJF_00370 [Fimbriimonadaceae bacterium]|nr:hypothetical protein [Fimbriimonadaceae bacterium]